MSGFEPELERARRYYDAFAESYEAHRDGRGRYHDLLDALEIEFAAPAVAGREVLEVGCGTGLLLRALAPLASRAVGVDLSPGMLARARQRGLEVVEGSATALPFADATFDVAVSFKTLPHVPDLAGALSEMARVVRPGGTMFVELYNPRSVRALLKRAFAGRVGAGTERDVMTRFDDRRALERALPAGCVIETARGIRTVTVVGRLLDLPLLGGILERAERRLADLKVGALVGGLVVYRIRRGR
jgi:ubiquinone/menaquinone biosynthesis C-methylase UbiE